jgi:CrcB protein
MNPYVLVAIGGVFGAIGRFAVSTLAAARWGVAFPIGTLIINVSGSAAMGFVLTFLPEHFGGGHDASLLIATGFLGAYTTFSTFAFESVGLSQRGRHGPMLLNLSASVLGGAAGATTGILLATLVNRVV